MMSEDLEREIAELRRRLAELEAKLEEPKPEFVPSRPYAPIDWTAGMRLPADAAKAMASVVPDVKRKPTADEIASACARSRISGPSGFGPTQQAGKREGKREEGGKERSAFERWR